MTYRNSFIPSLASENILAKGISATFELQEKVSASSISVISCLLAIFSVCVRILFKISQNLVAQFETAVLASSSTKYVRRVHSSNYLNPTILKMVLLKTLIEKAINYKFRGF